MPLLRTVGFLILFLPLYAQTTLRLDESVGVFVPASSTPTTLAGSTGYRVIVPADAIRLVVKFQDFNYDFFTTYDFRVRPSVDVMDPTLFVDLVSYTFADHTRIAMFPTAYRPQEANYFIGFLIPARSIPFMGVLTASVERFPSGASATVPSAAQIMLAGQPSGTTYRGIYSVPQNSPPRVNMSITPGQGYKIASSGGTTYTVLPVSTFVHSSGTTANQTLTSASGIAGLIGPRAALIGLFLGPGSQPQDLSLLSGPPDFFGVRPEYNTGNTDDLVVKPLLRQPFYIGTGLTSSRSEKVFVAPTGATDLYLGVLESSNEFSYAGSITAIISAASIPSPTPSNPAVVTPNAQVMLAAQGDHVTYGSYETPWESPVEAGIAVVPGQRLVFVPKGLIFYPTTATISSGLTEKQVLQAGNGFSGISGPRGSLIGVFTGASANPQLNPARLDFNIVDPQETIQPQLQQLFYIGNGVASTLNTKRFVVPAGASRLFLGILEGQDRSIKGQYSVNVAADLPNAPSITAITNGAGYKQTALASGSIVAIFGKGFGDLAQASTVPLPTSLSDTEVWFDEFRAPLFFVSPNQINAQIPVEIGSRLTTYVMVKRAGVPGQAAYLGLGGFQAGIYIDGSSNPIIVNNSTGRLVSEAEPARANDVLIIYASGLGPVAPQPVSGQGAPLTTLLRGVAPVRALISQNGRQFSVPASFSGLAPGFIGTFQVNVAMPTGLSAGRAQIRLVSDGVGSANSPDYTLFVGN